MLFLNLRHTTTRWSFWPALAQLNQRWYISLHTNQLPTFYTVFTTYNTSNTGMANWNVPSLMEALIRMNLWPFGKRESRYVFWCRVLKDSSKSIQRPPSGRRWFERYLGWEGLLFVVTWVGMGEYSVPYISVWCVFMSDTALLIKSLQKEPYILWGLG